MSPALFIFQSRLNKVDGERGNFVLAIPGIACP